MSYGWTMSNIINYMYYLQNPPYQWTPPHLLKSPWQGQLCGALRNELFTLRCMSKLVGVDLFETSRGNDPSHIVRLSNSTIIWNLRFSRQHSRWTIPSGNFAAWHVQRLAWTLIAISRRLVSLVVDQSSRVKPCHFRHLCVVGQIGFLPQDKPTVILLGFLAAG